MPSARPRNVRINVDSCLAKGPNEVHVVLEVVRAVATEPLMHPRDRDDPSVASLEKALGNVVLRDMVAPCRR